MGLPNQPSPNSANPEEQYPIFNFGRGIMTDNGPVAVEGALLQAMNVVLGNGVSPRPGSDVMNAGFPFTVGAGTVLGISELVTRSWVDNSIEKYFIVFVDNDGVFEVRLAIRSGNTFTITGEQKLHEEWPLGGERVYYLGRPRYINFNNRLFMVNGDVTWDEDRGGDAPVGFTEKGDRYWTDGTDGYRLGVGAPNSQDGEGLEMVVESVSTANGLLTEGEEYLVGITYERSFKWSTEGNPWTTMVDGPGGSTIDTVTIGVGHNALKVTLNWSDISNNDPQVDRVNFYRTREGDQVTYFYVKSIEDIAPDADPQKIVYLETDDATITEIGKVMSFTNNRPPRSLDVTEAAGRVFYFTNTFVYFSKDSYGEQVPLNYRVPIALDDGQSIRGGGAFKNNYILVLKTGSAYLFNGDDPTREVPVSISGTTGVAEINTLVFVPDEGIAMWLSQHGDLVSTSIGTFRVMSLTSSRQEGMSSIRNDLVSGIDFSRIQEANGLYNPMTLTATWVLPYKNGYTRTWNYSLITGSFSKYLYPYQILSQCIISDENSEYAWMAAAKMAGTLASVDDERGYLLRMNYNPDGGVKDVSKPSDVASEYEVVTSEVVTPYVFFGEPQRRKNLSRAHFLWAADDEMTAEFSVSYDYGFLMKPDGSNPRTIEIVHDGGSGTKTIGADEIAGWDYSRAQHFPKDVPNAGFGRSFSMRFKVASEYSYQLYGWVVHFKREEILINR